MRARRDRLDILAAVVLALLVMGTAVIAPSSCAPVRDEAEFHHGEILGRSKYSRAEMAPVPEPSTYGLAAAGLLLGVVILKRLRTR
ncbi:MAG: PEP-CTERM sorting domain-containing protein [Opitutaceae bacterium]